MQSIDNPAPIRKQRVGRTLSKQVSERTAHSFRLPRSVLNRSVEEFFVALNTPLSLSCYMLYVAGEDEQLVRKEIDPLQYNDANRFRDDFAAVSFLRKADPLETGIDRRAVALDGFRAAEEQCKRTNARFRHLESDPNFSGSNVWLLHSLVRKISVCLGEFDIAEFFDSGSWGPGVTADTKGSDVSASRKFHEERGVTQQLYPLISSSFPYAYPLWFEGLREKGLKLCQGNSVITVPKNAKTDRTIGIEPGINSWFQLSAGRMIRRRLRRAGYDLNSDVKNQYGALKGSREGGLATVDFSAASDTIAARVVEEILPLRWFTVLDACRSHVYTVDGSSHCYEKFSAMGCGFTFELESAIFVHAALACCEYLGADTADVAVFGDDIILPIEAFDLYSSFCKFLGFTVNQKKSFSTGYFRESCGAYFFNGIDVKPLFVKTAPTTLRSVFSYVNQLRALAHRRNHYIGCDSAFRPVWSYLVRMIPSEIRFRGPRDAGEAVIHDNLDNCRYRPARFWIEGYTFLGLKLTPKTIYKEDQGLLLAAIWKNGSRTGNNIPLRSETKQRIATLFAARWYDYGTWT